MYPATIASADFSGANRAGDNLFANSLLALEAATGGRIWHFQTVRHDLWDRDLSSPPSLVTVLRRGRRVDAVAQTTKHGYVFLFDRTDGTPLFPIEYRQVPASPVEDVEDAKPGEIHTAFSEEELRDIRETLGWLKAAGASDGSLSITTAAGCESGLRGRRRSHHVSRPRRI